MCSSGDWQPQGNQESWEDISTQVNQMREALAVLSDRLDKQQSQIKALKEQIGLGSPDETAKKRSASQPVKDTSAGWACIPEQWKKN